MIPANRKSAALAFVALLFMPGMEVAAQSNGARPAADQMTIWQARRMLVAGTEYVKWHGGEIDRGSFRFTPDSFEFDVADSKTGTQHFKVEFKLLEPASVKCNKYGRKVVACFLKNDAGKFYHSPLSLVWREGSIWTASCSSNCVHAAESFAAALNRLRAVANDTESPLNNFPQRAAAWRALASKPPIPEEVRVQRLLAEDAVKQKKPEEALNSYETGLELDPTWPQGYFNAALIADELGFYAEAIEHMQAYLELVPDAQDAQAARDQIVIWQYKAKGAK